MSPFLSTHWSLVLAAGQGASPESDRALAELCQKYWHPVYAYLRRRVADLHEAQDLTQGFFVRLLEKKGLASADPERGRFRSFLLTAVKNYVANARDRAHAQKRGGGHTLLALDFAGSDSRFTLEPAHTLTPEKLFDRHWAVLLLEEVLGKLRRGYRAANQEKLFDHLKSFLTGDLGPSLAEIGHLLDMTEGAVKTAAHRLRKRYRALLRAEVAQTVADPAEIDAEIRGLFEALGN